MTRRSRRNPSDGIDPPATPIHFLGDDEIKAALRELSEIARTQGIDMAVAGGVAMQIFGSDRLTKDVDVVATAVPDGLTVERALTFGGVGAKSPHGHPVDIIVRSDGYRRLYRAALDHAVHYIGTPLRVVTMEYMAAIKLAAARPKDEGDLEYLLTETRLDRARARGLIEQHLGVYAADDFDRVVEECDWLAERRRRHD